MPFVKGKSGNPNGRPPAGWTLAESMRDFLTGKDPKTKKERLQEFIEDTYKHAKAGDPTSKKLIWNYIDGMPAQPIDVTSKGKELTGLTIVTDGSTPE